MKKLFVFLNFANFCNKDNIKKNDNLDIIFNIIKNLINKFDGKLLYKEKINLLKNYILTSLFQNNISLEEYKKCENFFKIIRNLKYGILLDNTDNIFF